MVPAPTRVATEGWWRERSGWRPEPDRQEEGRKAVWAQAALLLFHVTWN